MLTRLLMVIAVCVLPGVALAQDDSTTQARDPLIIRFELETPGGPLPFVMRYTELMTVSQPPGSGMEILNGEETIGVVSYANWSRDKPEFESYKDKITFPEYLAEIWWSIGNQRGRGVYTKERGCSTAKIPLTTRYVESIHDRFDREHPADPEAVEIIDGRWKVDFASSDDPAIGVFEVTEDGLATGTFLTTTGDYRFLEGRVDGRTLKLSCFDGGHAFLFHATLSEEGTLEGDFWSGDWWHDTWTATPAPDDIELPDGFGLSTWDEGVDLSGLTFTATHPNPGPASLEGVIAVNGGYPAIIHIFGTWCPNCHDAAEAIKGLRQRHDITVVGLAFELTFDIERADRQFAAFGQKHGVDWPILLAGVADKDEASKLLPALDRVRAYPTTLFVNARGEVEAVHTGFTGPAAPDEHAALMEKWDAFVRVMLDAE